MEKKISGRVDKLHAAALFTTILLVIPVGGIISGIASNEGKVYGISKIVELIEAK